MWFSWRQWRRKRLLSQPFPKAWEEPLYANVSHYPLLSPDERAKLHDDLRIVVAETNWEGCGGLKMTEEIQVTVAGIASLLLLGLQNEHFESVLSILVYPNDYLVQERNHIGAGLTIEQESARSGEAWYRGPVILSWDSVVAGGQGRWLGRNVVLHEFAHQLDMQNGQIADGTPILASEAVRRRWQNVIHSEFESLLLSCQHNQPTLLDCYGTKNVGELFAVATEAFFELPHDMSYRHPELYELFQEYYRQDPAVRSR